jgi:hypothetical protein
MSNNDFSTIELHSELNPQLWVGEDLESPVQVALLRIAREFYEFLDFDAPLEDIQITGSQANYTYSKYSDIDLHLIVNYKNVTCDQPVEAMFDAKRRLWKERHDITIHGIPVEVYVEDTNKPVTGSSYSILNDAWIRRPKKIHAHWDDSEISRETLIWLEHIKDALASQDLERIEKTKEDLGHYRRAGLRDQGEFGSHNLAYKNLRNLGVVSLLMQALTHLEDRDLSI